MKRTIKDVNKIQKTYASQIVKNFVKDKVIIPNQEYLQEKIVMPLDVLDAAIQKNYIAIQRYMRERDESLSLADLLSSKISSLSTKISSISPQEKTVWTNIGYSMIDHITHSPLPTKQAANALHRLLAKTAFSVVDVNTIRNIRNKYKEAETIRREEMKVVSARTQQRETLNKLFAPIKKSISNDKRLKRISDIDDFIDAIEVYKHAHPEENLWEEISKLRYSLYPLSDTAIPQKKRIINMLENI